MTHKRNVESFCRKYIWNRSKRDRLLAETVNPVTFSEMRWKLAEEYPNANLEEILYAAPIFLREGGEVLIDQHGMGFAEYLQAQRGR